MRAKDAELKVTLVGAEVGRGVDAFELGVGEPLSVSFIEDTTTGVDLPLFNAGVVLRIRERGGTESDDSTVKFRPCRWSQLSAPWERPRSADDEEWKYKLEEDWAGARRVLAASFRADRRQGVIDDVRAGRKLIGSLFIEEQEQFLASCAPLAVNLEALTLLPAVAATSWPDVRVSGVKDVVAERWQVGELDFLELSTRVPLAKAEGALKKLEAGVDGHGLRFGEAKTKTELVLHHLTKAARGDG